MDDVDSDLLVEAVLSRADFISSTLIAGVILGLTVALARFAHTSKFELLGIDLPIKWFPWILAGYTLAHAYCAYLFATVCGGAKGNVLAWNALVLKGPLVFAGMLPRMEIGHIPIVNVPKYEIDSCDPTLYLFYGFCIAIGLTAFWSCSIAGYSRRTSIILTLVLLMANWLIGSWWAQAASRMHG